MSFKQSTICYRQTDFWCLWHEPEQRYFILEWYQPPTSREFRKVALLLLEGMRTEACFAFLHDVTRLGVLDDDDTRWISGVWLPQALRIGFCRNAIFIPPTHPIHWANYEDRIVQAERVDGGRVARQAFTSLEAARAWLEEDRLAPWLAAHAPQAAQRVKTLANNP